MLVALAGLLLAASVGMGLCLPKYATGMAQTRNRDEERCHTAKPRRRTNVFSWEVPGQCVIRNFT